MTILSQFLNYTLIYVDAFIFNAFNYEYIS